MMIRPILACLLALSLGACNDAAPKSSDPTGSETHWLTLCSSDSDCDKTSCLCGVCSSACMSASECGGALDHCSQPGDESHDELCSEQSVGADDGVCLPSCTTHCGKDERCVDGACVTGSSSGVGTSEGGAEATTGGGQPSAGSDGGNVSPDTSQNGMEPDDASAGGAGGMSSTGAGEDGGSTTGPDSSMMSEGTAGSGIIDSGGPSMADGSPMSRDGCGDGVCADNEICAFDCGAPVCPDNCTPTVASSRCGGGDPSFTVEWVCTGGTNDALAGDCEYVTSGLVHYCCPESAFGACAVETSCRSSQYPNFDRACATSSDCFLGIRTWGSCPSQQIVSYNVSEQQTLDEYNADCANILTFEDNCDPSVLQAQDGAVLNDVSEAVAECVDGMCLARSAAHAGECLDDSQTCIDGDTDGVCTAATGPVGTGYCRASAGLCTACKCMAPDTPIATPEGERPVSEIKVGDLVYSVEDAAIVVVPVERINRVPVEDHQVLRIRLEDGAELNISAGHPTADGRLFADLTVGGQLDGTRIVSVRYVPYESTHTYDILPASGTGTYFAGGALIGSTLAPPIPSEAGLGATEPQSLSSAR